MAVIAIQRVKLVHTCDKCEFPPIRIRPTEGRKSERVTPPKTRYRLLSPASLVFLEKSLCLQRNEMKQDFWTRGGNVDFSWGDS